MSCYQRELAALGAGEYSKRLGLRVASADSSVAATVLPFGDCVRNRGGRIHGGAIVSVLMAAGRLSAAASERSESGRLIQPVAINVSFLSAPADGSLTALAWVLRRGRDVAHVALSARDVDGAEAAVGSLTCAFVDADRVSVPAPARAGGDAEIHGGEAKPITASPFLSAAGLEIYEPNGGLARARLPECMNRAENPRRVDEGAIAGMVDSCAAFASHLAQRDGVLDGGVTVAMTIFFHGPVLEDLVGSASVVASSAALCTAQVEVVGAASGQVAAAGSAVYRVGRA